MINIYLIVLEKDDSAGLLKQACSTSYKVIEGHYL
jgi:hypothetical protein